MSKLDDLINKLCPDGVEYKTLGELGEFYGGLTGKGKNDFIDGNAKFITYMNVYKNLKLKLDVPEKVKINPGEKQRTLEYGDVLFTGSSETPDECGISSVLADKTDEKLYLNSFCICFRFNDPTIFNPEFSKYLFRSQELRVQIGKTASGVTRFNVSKEKMKKVIVPIVPLEIQNEIVRILDNFTELEKELEKELEARRKQYEYYRDSLLTFDDSVEWKTLGEISTVNRGIRVTRDMLSTEGSIPVYQNALEPLGYFEKSNRKKDTTFVISAGAAGQIGYSGIDFWAADDCFTFDDTNNVLSKYIFYFLQTKQTYIDSRVRRGSIPRISRDVFEKMKIPLPKIEVQKRIVDILDRFESLTTDITSGLPAEIEARHKQYEYYRDKLLTFKREDEK